MTLLSVDTPSRPPLVRRTLQRLGRGVRRRTSFGLLVTALTWGVARAALRPSTWRRTVRAEFGRALRQAVSGGVSPTLVTGAMIGLVMVYQALYWFGAAGQEALIGPVLVTVLMREIAPVLVGLILLGRSGMVAIAEIGALRTGGELRALEAQGLDPFLLLLLPRACAFAVSCFTLSMVFVITALVFGFALGSVIGTVKMSMLSFLDTVLSAMNPVDFVTLPGKMVLVGVLVALTAGLTGFMAGPRDTIASLLPRGFVRGVLAVIGASALLSLVA